MFPDYTFEMLLTLKGSIEPLNDNLYYTAIKGQWQLRDDQHNFKDWRDPAQEYINSLGMSRSIEEVQIASNNYIE